MPTYEYECGACGHRFEKFHSITAAPIKDCPQCKKKKVKRLISSGAALIFKGSGFYITDYRSDSYKSAAKSDSGAAPTTTATPAAGSSGGGAAASTTSGSSSSGAASSTGTSAAASSTSGKSSESGSKAGKSK